MTFSAVDVRIARRLLRRSPRARTRRPRAVAVTRPHGGRAALAAAARLPGPFLALLLLLALLLAAVGCGSTASGPATPGAPVEALQIERLINLRLSPALSRWLVGPVAVLATPEEERAFLATTSDEEAEAFIDEFWERRKPYPERPDNPLRERFEARVAEADKQFREGGRRGSQTARGTIHVLFGEPTRSDYQIAPDPRDSAIEVWYYEPGEWEPAQGLAAEPPAPYYRFIKRDDVTDFYRPRTGVERARPVRPGEGGRPIGY